jgi:hypothetical protein
MKLRILSYGFSASHSAITHLPNFGDAITISDYDAFVFDPLGFQGISSIDGRGQTGRFPFLLACKSRSAGETGAFGATDRFPLIFLFEHSFDCQFELAPSLFLVIPKEFS